MSTFFVEFKKVFQQEQEQEQQQQQISRSEASRSKTRILYLVITYLFTTVRFQKKSIHSKLGLLYF